MNFTYTNNAKVINDFLYVRDSDGNILPDRRVDIGYNITVLDVSYSKQLALVEYPTPNGVRSGYVKNATNCIEYFNENTWQNGSTTETVYDENGALLGSLEPFEKATPLYEKNGMIHAVYNTDKGTNTKSGYVKYRGTTSVSNKACSSNETINNGADITTGMVSDTLVDFVKSYEGFYDHSYDYGTGVMTIGYGRIRKDRVSLGHCTESQALL